jgi:pimeloyl-ACP methyl ester carboxylesterase
MRFETGADDAVQFLDTLRKDPRFSKVLVLGHSEGSLLGMLLAQKER